MNSVKYGGFRGRILRINLSKSKISVENVPAEWALKYLGGRGLGARYYYQEIGPETPPLSPENKLIIMTGPLTGTAVFGSTKSYIVTKSPLTNHYFVTNAGGYFGANIKFAKYDGLIVEGKAEKPVFISIIDDDVRLNSASHLWGLKISEAQEAIREEVGEKRVSVACIGPAGEKLSKIACIQADFTGLMRGGSFGRGGIGAVMGSKNLKAISVYGSKEVDIAKPDKLSDFLRESLKRLRETTGYHTKYGTAQYTEVLYELGAYPLFNFTKTRVESGMIESLFAQIIREKFVIRDVACFRCPVACGKFSEAHEGAWKGVQSKPEYETIWSFGPHCGVFDFNIIIAANRIADDFGLDGISAGYVIGFTMELYERKVIDKGDVDGIDLRFGNGEAEIELLLKMAKREGVGNILAEGAVRAAEAFGKNAAYYAMHVKGLELTGYEPRAFYGMGLTYATSSRGACHNVGGWTIRDELLKPKIDRYAVKGKGMLVKTIQDVRGYIDSLGLCTIPRRSIYLTDTPKAEVLNFVTGANFTGRSLIIVGERVYNLERVILNREGISRRDDILPSRIMTEPVPDGPAKGRVLSPDIFNAMLDEYYQVRGWSSDGYVTEQVIKRLEIP